MLGALLPKTQVVAAHTEVELKIAASIQQPTLFITAENDWAFPEKLIPQVVDALKARADYTPDKFRVERYADTYHGFCVRGDESNPVIQKAKKKALGDTVGFFRTHGLQL